GRAAREATALKRLMRDDASTFHDLMAALAEMTVSYLRAQVSAGVQALQLFDSWVGTLSPWDYERSVAPHMRRIFAGLADAGVPLIHFGSGSAGLLEA